MRPTRVQPTGVERTFGEDEIIVSKTDRRGVITYANDVFIRVSQYSESELVGKPHNIIRHPDMPRCVFKLLWDTLAEGREIFAYVVNLAADGAHYWVLAHVTPSYNRAGELVGYHSNRRSPYRGAVNAVSELYAKPRAEEQRHSRPADAIEASSRMLQEILAERGETYEEFVWGLTNGSAA